MAVMPSGLLPVEDLTPSVLEVSQLLRARTKDASGNELGVFNDATRPTSAQVAGLAQTAAVDIQGRLGESPPPEIVDAGRGVAALLAACMIELSYFPEQVESGRSPYQQLRELLDLRLGSLMRWVGAGEDGPVGGQEVRSLRMPVLGEEVIDEDGVAHDLIPRS